MRLKNGNPIQIQPPDLLISSDAAGGHQGGWGAHCGKVSVGGQWTEIERKEHINVLELKAVFLAIRKFTKNKGPKSIHLLIDNQVAAAHIT